MYLSESTRVENGHLMIGGADALDLAREYGTPLYVMDEELIRKRCRIYRRALQKYYGGNGQIYYATKSFFNTAMARIVKQEGIGVDVVSAGELHIALAGGIDPAQIHFNGNNKSEEELRLAIKLGIGRIMVDNFHEIDLIEKITRECGRDITVAVRITPGVEAHTHQYIMTALLDSKFGFTLANGDAMKALARLRDMAHVTVSGISCHIGSQLFETEPYQLAVDKLVTLIASVREELGLNLEEIGVGGGFGVPYTADDQQIDYEQGTKLICDFVRTACEKQGLAPLNITIEPGRSIVADAGVTLYRAGTIKRIPGVRTYVCVDGGMTDNIRYALYHANYTLYVANKMDVSERETVTVAGKCCESGDIIQEHVSLPPVEPDDLIAVLCTGAYNYAMSSNYNGALKPAIVMVRKGKARLVTRRETLDDLMARDC